MLIESFNRLAVRIRDDNLAQVFPQRLKNGTRLRVGPLIQNLTQVSQTGTSIRSRVFSLI